MSNRAGDRTGNPALPPWLLHGSMLVSAVLVSTSFPVGKAITPFMDPVLLTLIRFCLAALLFAPYVRRRFGLTNPGLAALGRYSLISVALVGFFWLMFLSLRFTNSLHTGVLFTMVPGISGIYSWFLLRERLGTGRVLALLLAMVGAVWVIFEGEMEQLRALQFNHGDLLFFGGCLLMALYTPLVKLLHRGEPMAVMTFWILVTGCGWLLLFTLLKPPAELFVPVPARVWAGIAYLAVFTTIITFFISQWATLHLGPTRVMAYSYLYPPLIVFIDWSLSGALPDLRTLAGVLIILPAMYVVQRGDNAPVR
ncbi:MAG: DMT family transporter [Desulfobulbus sp.]|jgi:drug/metabolite transporter (DMT)-like permease|nr:DMT family transporter [Desulfobulbus sp.]